jgi:hypothetical protein
VGENAEMRACVKLLCPGAGPSYGEKGEQRTALHRAMWELFGWAVLISTTQSRQAPPPKAFDAVEERWSDWS